MKTAVHKACYSIHGNVTLRIETCDEKKIQAYDVFFRHFRVADTCAGKTYRIFDFNDFRIPPEQLPNRNGIVVFDSGFCLPESQYALVHDAHGITEYSGLPIITTTLFWLQFLLCQQNLSFIHGAALGLCGKTVVFPGLSGCGKTLLALLLKDHPGYSFFSDEYTLAGADGTIYANPCDFSIFPVHCGHLSDFLSAKTNMYFLEREKILSRINLLGKIPVPSFLQRIKGAGIAELATQSAGPAHLKIPVSDLIPPEKQGTTSKVTTAILLKRYDVPEIQIKNIGLQEYCGRVVGITNIEFLDAWNLLHTAAACSFPDSHSFGQKQRDIIHQAFSGADLYEARIPYKIKPAVLAGEIAGFLASAGK
jgi:hypothetical protein